MKDHLSKKILLWREHMPMSFGGYREYVKITYKKMVRNSGV
jgi:hypothetical protein